LFSMDNQIPLPYKDLSMISMSRFESFKGEHGTYKKRPLE